MTNTLLNKYGQYYSASGSYRKRLMQRESANAAEMYDYFSHLGLRCNQIIRCDELIKSPRRDITEMVMAARGFVRDMSAAADIVFGHDGDRLHSRFAELYDEAASIVEGFERLACEEIGRRSGSISEDAQSIQRRNHFAKNHAKSSDRSLSAKMSWKRDRSKRINAINKFHKSSAGKQFHRNLARYNQRKTEEFQFGQDDILTTAKGVSSLITHAIIELQSVLAAGTDAVTGVDMEYAAQIRDIIDMFIELMSILVDALFDKNVEAVGNVLEVIADYYSVTGAGDKQLPDSSGVEVDL